MTTGKATYSAVPDPDNPGRFRVERHELKDGTMTVPLAGVDMQVALNKCAELNRQDGF